MINYQIENKGTVKFNIIFSYIILLSIFQL